MEGKWYPVFLVILILILACSTLVIIGFCIRELFNRNKPPSPGEFKRVIVPHSMTRKVQTYEELKNICAIRGDMAYVNDEDSAYFYTGENWVKVKQDYHGNKRKETGE